MKITNHATERFLQRVKKRYNYTKSEFVKTKKELQNLFKDIITNRTKIVVPGFNKFLAVVKNQTVITILEK